MSDPNASAMDIRHWLAALESMLIPAKALCVWMAGVECDGGVITAWRKVSLGLGAV